MYRCAQPIRSQSAIYCWPVWLVDDSLSGLRSSELDIEHTLAHRKRVWIGRHRIKANFNVSETHLDRRASSGSTFDSRAKAFFSVLGDAGNAFRATSIERERNYTSSRRSDQNSIAISCDERRAGAKPWWGPFEAPSVPIWLVSRNVA